MSVLVEAIMQYSMTPVEILGLPKLLGGDWKWARENVDEIFLRSYWDRQVEWYLKNEWSEQDLAIIDGPDMSIHFFEPNLYSPTLSCLKKWAKNKYLTTEFLSSPL